MEDAKKSWCLWPKPLISAQKDQICILVNLLPPQSDIPFDEKTFQKNTRLLIFRTFENLLQIYPALSNLSRKGVSKDKILNAFSKLTYLSLKDEKFDIPVFTNDAKNNNLNTKSSVKQSNLMKINKLPTIDENTNKNEGGFNRQKMKKNIKTEESMVFSKFRSKETEMSSIDLNSSFKTASCNNIRRKSSVKRVENKGLTNEALHPEQVFYFFSVEKDQNFFCFCFLIYNFCLIYFFSLIKK